MSLQLSDRISLPRLTYFVALLALASAVCTAQNADVAKLPPILDVHVHAMDASFPGLAPMCPNTSKFTASDPKGKEDAFGWVKEPCTPALYPANSGRVYERRPRRDGAPQRHSSRFWRPQQR